MKKYVNSVTRLFIFFLAASTAHFVAAKDLYISDKLYVPVRKGQGNQFSILHKGLPSGTRVILIQRDTDWTKVKTPQGITGWIRNQFLDDTPPAAIQLVSANKKIDRLSKQLSNLQAEKQSLENTYQATEQSLKESNQLAKKTEEELTSIKSISASAVESHQRLQSLAKKMQLLQTENDVLKSENESLRRSERTTFFIYGAFAVLLGVLVAIILPKLRSRKRNDGWLN
ncbi:MAG: TIGR04211 family SH3 domain-containing protein [Cellvibrionaceae bacterium]